MAALQEGGAAYVGRMSCVICCAAESHSDWSALAACGHVFHELCCQRWLQQQRSCPVCRAPVALSEATVALRSVETRAEAEDAGTRDGTQLAGHSEDQQSALAALQKERARLQQQQQDLQEQLRRMQQQQRDLQQLADMEQELRDSAAEWKHQAQHTVQELIATRKHVAALKSRCGVLKAKLSSERDEFASAKDVDKRELIMLKTARDVAEHRSQALEWMLARARDEAAESKRKLRLLGEDKLRLADIQQLTGQAGRDSEALATALAARNAELAQERARAASLAEQLAATEAAAAEGQQQAECEMDLLRSDLGKQAADAQRLDDDGRQLRSRVDVVTAQLAAAEAERDELRSVLQALEAGRGHAAAAAARLLRGRPPQQQQQQPQAAKGRQKENTAPLAQQPAASGAQRQRLQQAQHAAKASGAGSRSSMHQGWQQQQQQQQRGGSCALTAAPGSQACSAASGWVPGTRLPGSQHSQRGQQQHACAAGLQGLPSGTLVPGGGQPRQQQWSQQSQQRPAASEQAADITACMQAEVQMSRLGSYLAGSASFVVSKKQKLCGSGEVRGQLIRTGPNGRGGHTHYPAHSACGGTKRAVSSGGAAGTKKSRAQQVQLDALWSG